MKTCYQTTHLDKLKQKILSYTQVDDEVVQEQMQCYQRMDLKKGDTLVIPGQLVHHFYYVATGCIYYYKLDEGEQKVLEFYTDDVFFIDFTTFLRLKNFSRKAKGVCRLVS